jgi:hypothetical protein
MLFEGRRGVRVDAVSDLPDRKQRTPFWQIARLLDRWVQLVNEAGGDFDVATAASRLRKFVDDESSSGESTKRAMLLQIEQSDGESAFDALDTMFFAYCADAMRAILRASNTEAWSYIVDAQYCLDGFAAIGLAADTLAGNRKNSAKHALDARHRETRQTKADALAWYSGKRDEYETKDDAAEHIALVFPGVSFGKARKWLRNA